ncbi:MAG: RNA polymerase sigma factor [Phycisphaerae bacterium]|nr:RNA polymerase sigma factor [Gemmatimonadaceae bacterium]
MNALLPALQGARRGDRHAFAALVELLHPRAMRYALHMVGSNEDAEEAVQDTFVRVFDNLSRFREDAAFDPWFFRILANRCRTLIAKRKRRYSVIEYGDLPANASTAASTSGEFAAEIQYVLNQLPAEQREAFLLRHIEDMDYEDIAAVTGVGLSAVRMRVKRACDALRVQLNAVYQDV